MILGIRLLCCYHSGVPDDNLRPESLEWALTHIMKFGDTDIFPVPFEFACIKGAWAWLLPELQKIDLSIYRTRSTRRMLVPKANGGFRVATQLDPIDAIIYSALSYESAPLIEARRIPADQSVACSYRVDIHPGGRLFASESGWPEYHSRSEALSKSGKYTHVLVADIADFYNQIYTHRVQSALEMSSIPSARADNIEQFLLSLCAKQSRGVPVGPTASILFAEASLIDVDDFLLRRGFPFTRFVDDFRIFCKSSAEALKMQHDLVDYIYTSHRLILEPWKSRIISVREFRKKELIDPSEVERQSEVMKLQDLIDEILSESGYSIGEDDLLEEDKQKAVRENLSELFEGCIAKKPLHLGLARYLLRRATRLRTVVLNDAVFANLEALLPVFREVVLYLSASVPRKDATTKGRALVKFVKSSDYGQLPFVRMWVMELLRLRPDMTTPAAAMKLADNFSDSLGIRPAAQIAESSSKMDWMREQKELWANHSPLDRRAVIYAGSALPAKERRIWLDMVSNSTSDSLERAVAQYAKSR
jgi:Reverse transcriptase (RNA-dependent DNA polymerase)